MASFLGVGLSHLMGVQLAQTVGLKVGDYLGRQIVLGACLSDESDDLDPRTFRARTPSNRLPASVDLRRWMTPVENQGAIGSCTANALASAIEYLAARGANQQVDVSRLFIYFNQRLWRGSVRKDAGAAISWGIRALNRLGVPHERMWPYHPDLFAVQPPESVYRAALDHRIVDWCRVPIHPDAVRACLVEGFPIVFGVHTFESFDSIGDDGVCPLPRKGERDNGAHAMLIVGYDDREKLFIVRNSWGEDWGNRGYCYLPYDYVLHPKLSTSMWSVRLSADLTFEEGEHVRFDLSSLPKAPPPGAASGPVAPGSETGGGGGGILSTLGSIAGGGLLGGVLGTLNSGGTKVEKAAGLATGLSGIAATVLTGNAAIGGLFGGVVAGLAPSVVDRIQRDDSGALLGDDHSKEILATMRGEVDLAPPPALPPRYHWDDGFDEEALTTGLRNGSRPLHSQGTGALSAPQVPPPPPPGAAPPPAPSSRLSEPAEIGAAEALQARWAQLGGDEGALGTPASPPQQTTDGRSLWLPCERGALVRHPRGDIFMLLGPIYLLWWQMGAFTSQLGYPTSDEYDTSDPRAPKACRFEHGTLFFTPGYGAWLAPS